MKRKTKRVHFTGIKGVGMTPLALIAKEAGMRVSGSDIPEVFITDTLLTKAKIPVTAFDVRNVEGAELVITTGAHGGFDNVEVRVARGKGIPVMTQGEAVGKFMQGEILGREFSGISVTGTHGKTTTTAMVATVLLKNKMDPTFVIGTGNIPVLGASGHLGKGKFFVAEADEYATEPQYDKTPKFLWQQPDILVMTNVEYDHTDLYGSLQEVIEAFSRFAANLKGSGALVINGDDNNLKAVAQSTKARTILFGRGLQNDYVLKRATVSGQQTFFWVDAKGASLGEFCIPVIGVHNALNGLAALIVGLECGLSLDQVKKGLSAFTGTKRRSEYIGQGNFGAVIYDDYAHHPTEIQATLQALRQSFPKKKIICIFQPHMYSRTKKLFDHFIHSFSDADTAIIMDIYPSLREPVDKTFSTSLFVNAMSPFHPNPVFLPTASNVVEYIEQKRFGEDSVVVTMGAGDVYKIGTELVKKTV